MFASWGSVVYRARVTVIGIMVALLLGSAAYGLGLEKHLSQSGWDDPGSESVAAAKLADGTFGRDTNSDVGPIREGDWIGLVRGDGIVSVAPDVDGAATAVLVQLVVPGRELVTVFTGEGATPSATAAIEGWLADQRADVQVEVHCGGQPLYPYLFGVE